MDASMGWAGVGLKVDQIVSSVGARKAEWNAGCRTSDVTSKAHAHGSSLSLVERVAASWSGPY